MVVRGKVLLGAGRAIALLLVLSACHLFLPFSSVPPDPSTKPETTYKFKIPVYQCQAKGFKTADWDFTAESKVKEGLWWEKRLHVPTPPQHPQGQPFERDQQAYLEDQLVWKISKIDTDPVDPKFWPGDKTYGPHWLGADWISTQYDLPKTGQEYTLGIELRSNVRAVYVAVDDEWIRNQGVPPWLSQDYDPMYRLDQPKTLQMVTIQRTKGGVGQPIDLQIWKYKLDPHDPSKWKNQKTIWYVPEATAPWTAGLSPGRAPANYLLIIEPDTDYDCSGRAPGRRLQPQKYTSGSYPADTPENKQKARDAAIAWAKEQIKALTQYSGSGLLTLDEGQITEEDPDVPNHAVLLKEYQFELKPWGFPLSSQIAFDPNKSPSSSQVTFDNKPYSSNVAGSLMFDYVLDANGRVPLIHLQSLDLAMEPIALPEVTVKNGSVMMLGPTEAVSRDPPPLPWHQLADHYTIPPQGLMASIAFDYDKYRIVVGARNIHAVEVAIDHTNRRFRIQGGPLATKIPFQDDNGKLVEKDVAVEIDLTGVFVNFAPVAVTVESKTLSECRWDRTWQRSANEHALWLNSAGSFKLYNDPLPSNPAQFSWLADYGQATEHLLGHGKQLQLVPGTIGYGVHPVTLLIRDNYGAVARNTFELVVRDTQPPVLTPPPDITRLVRWPKSPPVKIDLGETWLQAYDTGTDRVGVTNDAPADRMFPAGVTQVTWSADDGHGNVTTKTQRVFVIAPPKKGTNPHALLEAVECLRKAVQTSGLLTNPEANNPNTAAALASLQEAAAALQEDIAEISLPGDLGERRANLVRELEELNGAIREEQADLTATRAAVERIKTSRKAALGTLDRAAELLRRAAPKQRD